MINYYSSTFPSPSLFSHPFLISFNSWFTNWDLLIPETRSTSSLDATHYFRPLPGTTSHYKNGKPMSRVLVSGSTSLISTTIYTPNKACPTFCLHIALPNACPCVNQYFPLRSWHTLFEFPNSQNPLYFLVRWHSIAIFLSLYLEAGIPVCFNLSKDKLKI